MDPARHGPSGQAPDPGGPPAAARYAPGPVWALPRWLPGFVAVVVLLDAAGLAFPPRGVPAPGLGGRHDLALFALLLACDVGSLELTRRAGEKAGVSRDMHALWELPVAILLFRSRTRR